MGTQSTAAKPLKMADQIQTIEKEAPKLKGTPASSPKGGGKGSPARGIPMPPRGTGLQAGYKLGKEA